MQPFQEARAAHSGERPVRASVCFMLIFKHLLDRDGMRFAF
jgi:hypothetical protein